MPVSNVSRLRDHFSLCVCAKERERRLTLTDIEAPELVPVPKKMMATNALKPDVFQDFPLEEKTVLSHNVAM